MISMDKYTEIRRGIMVDKKSISRVSRETGLSRNTVKKYLNEQYEGYKPRQRQEWKALELYKEFINDILEEDRKAPRKQRHTARRIYTRMVQELGYKGAESTVRRYVKMAKEQMGIGIKEAFIPLVADIGKECEVDWGKAVVIIGGEKIDVKFFCMRSKYSGKVFVRLYPCERSQAFIDGHLKAFEYFGGIFPVIIYDNLSVAVRKILDDHGRIEQDKWLKFRLYHSFEAKYANPSAGNEKGGVENSIGYVRRNFLVPIPRGNSLEEINEKLIESCNHYDNHRIDGHDGKVGELYEKEREYLINLPERPYENNEVVSCKVNKYSVVNIDKNRYSVPTNYVGYRVTAILTVNIVEIYANSKLIAVHKRLYNVNRWQVNPMHYLEVIYQKVRAFDNARPIVEWRQSWPQVYEEILSKMRQRNGETKGTREFLEFLMLHKIYDAGELESAAQLAVENGIYSKDGILQILRYLNEGQMETETVPGYDSIIPVDISQYSQLNMEVHA